MTWRSGLLLLLVALLARPLRADVIRLVSGEEVSCHPLRHLSNEANLVVKDLKSGQIRTLSWSDLEEPDRTRLVVAWTDPFRNQRGHWMWVQLDAGESSLVVGLKEDEKGDAILVRRSGALLPIAKARLLEVVEDDVDPRDIWTGPQLLERFARDLAERDPPQSLTSPQGRVAFKVGEYAEWAGAFEQARDAFRRAAADAAFARRSVAEQRAQRLEALLKEPGATALLAELRPRLADLAFSTVRRALSDYEAKHPAMGEAARLTLASFREEADAKRDRVLRYVAGHELATICRRLIEDRVKDPALHLAEARTWAKKDLADTAFATLARRMPGLEAGEDPTPYWHTRWDDAPKGPWQRARYGSGSFIVHPPAGPLPPGQGPEVWWEKSGAERAAWLFAEFVQASGLFELAEEPEKSPCPACLGTGTRSMTTQKGEAISFRCDRCGGTQFDYTVKFR